MCVCVCAWKGGDDREGGERESADLHGEKRTLRGGSEPPFQPLSGVHAWKGGAAEWPFPFSVWNPLKSLFVGDRLMFSPRVRSDAFKRLLTRLALGH